MIPVLQEFTVQTVVVIGFEYLKRAPQADILFSQKDMTFFQISEGGDTAQTGVYFTSTRTCVS